MDLWYILEDSPHLDTSFDDKASFGYNHPKKVQDTLKVCRAKLSYSPNQLAVSGCPLRFDKDPCDHPSCSWYPKLDQSRRIKSHKTGIKHPKINTKILFIATLTNIFI